jgi:hypothetical protein
MRSKESGWSLMAEVEYLIPTADLLFNRKEMHGKKAKKIATQSLSSSKN